MKQLIFLLKNVFLAGVFAMAFAGCSKDEGSELNGTWMFRDMDFLYYVGGQVFSALEESPAAMQEINRDFRGLFFIFSDGNLSAGMGGQTYPWGTYTVSGNKITLHDGSTTGIMQYAISGKNMDLTFNRSSFEMLLGGLPDELYYFDDMEAILSFNRVD
jgi:hypothetical protein